MIYTSSCEKREKDSKDMHQDIKGHHPVGNRHRWWPWPISKPAWNSQTQSKCANSNEHFLHILLYQLKQPSLL